MNDSYMILEQEEDGNLKTHKKGNGSGNPDISAWAGELRRNIASSEAEASSLRSRAEVLQARADTLRQMAQASDAKTKALRDLLKQMEATTQTLGPIAGFKTRQPSSRGSNLTVLVRERAKEILRAAGHPLGRTEILAQLIDDGVFIKSAKPAQRVGKILWESDEFEYQDKGYWLVGEPIAPGFKREKRFRAPNRKKSS
ncbi:hypothetical protein [Rhizobium ruizarguesonis]|uniref:hypothetical protein n=1 Tax=Rhizobium ruizarguesonis TaxID=2081791 RepID=UPI001032151F|nr:hypothetical protein [Rhizobium ruizarguesonis]TAY79770.1 hypothetical protein ELH86_12855 [Rhizobium ruizarguesonis]TBD21881.1 hypothetical protein ELH23_13855 [Rhizobium ruizarguesonis]